MKSFQVGKNTVGEESPPLFFPDIDVYFNKDLSVAESLIHQLSETGTNIIKGAVLHNIDMVFNDETPQGYMTHKGIKEEPYRDIMARKIIPLSHYEKIFKLVHSVGCDLVLSVYDKEGADFSRDIGACALKIPTSNITHEWLIQYTAQLKLPMIIDTGKSTLEEISRAVQWAIDAGTEQLIIQHSPAAPPAPLENHDLHMLTTLKSSFDFPVGLSDHHSSEEMLYAAVALGASVLEKGIVADDQGEDIDVYHAMRIGQVKEVLGKCRRIHTALGKSMRHLKRDRAKPNDRMGLIANKDLKPGEKINSDTVNFAFPVKGISAENWSLVEGNQIKRPIHKGAAIKWPDIEFLDT